MNYCVPHQVNEHESDMRAVKEGWYAMEENGTLLSAHVAAVRTARAKSAGPPGDQCPSEIYASCETPENTVVF
jgi:hypothetical protein